MVTRLDRLTRSMHVAARVASPPPPNAGNGQSWHSILLSTPRPTQGGALVEVLALFDEMERKLTGVHQVRPESLHSCRPPAETGPTLHSVGWTLSKESFWPRKSGATWAAIADESQRRRCAHGSRRQAVVSRDGTPRGRRRPKPHTVISPSRAVLGHHSRPRCDETHGGGGGRLALAWRRLIRPHRHSDLRS